MPSTLFSPLSLFTVIERRGHGGVLGALKGFLIVLLKYLMPSKYLRRRSWGWKQCIFVSSILR